MERWFIKNSIVLLTLVLVSCWSQLLMAQDSDLFKLWPDSALARANSAHAVDYMNESEKQVVYFINLCRMNPALFESTILQDYLKSQGIRKDKQVKALMEELQATQKRVLLQPNKALTEVARTHAKDMGETGRTGHSASDGTSFRERLADMSGKFRGVNENANYGLEDPLSIVIDLLIDRDVPNVGHRKNILDADMRFIGVAIEPHKRWKFNCVQDFGGERVK